jgi:AcrR family transcriptional regulator
LTAVCGVSAYTVKLVCAGGPGNASGSPRLAPHARPNFRFPNARSMKPATSAVARRPAEPAGGNRRGAQTRQRVIEITKGLIGELGYTAVTLDRIAADAGVAKSSLLWHFGSKEMLLAEAAISLFQQIEQDLHPAGVAGLSPDELIDLLFDKVAEYFTRNPESKGVVLALLFSDGLPPEVRDHIRAGWDGHVRAIVAGAGEAEEALSPEMARLLLAVFHGCYCHWYANGRSEPIAHYLAPARELFAAWLQQKKKKPARTK